MQCEKCNDQVRVVVHDFEGHVDLVCGCRTVMVPLMGVIENAKPAGTDDSVARPEADSGGGDQVTERPDSFEAPERAAETAAADEGVSDATGYVEEVADGGSDS